MPEATICNLMTAEQIREIAENLDVGLRCFVHKESLKTIFVPDEDKYPDITLEYGDQELREIKKARNEYVEIEGMDSGESFRVMEEFVESVDDERLRDRLEQALGRPKPFSNFKVVIDRSGSYRDKWFAFKTRKLVEWVEEQLLRMNV